MKTRRFFFKKASSGTPLYEYASIVVVNVYQMFAIIYILILNVFENLCRKYHSLGLNIFIHFYNEIYVWTCAFVYYIVCSA